jgi:hypothetical protein
MVHRHNVNQLASDTLGILLLNKLGEDALEVRELQRIL